MPLYQLESLRLISSVATTSGNSFSFTNIPNNFAYLSVNLRGCSLVGADTIVLELSTNNGGAWFGSNLNIALMSGAADAAYNDVNILRSRYGGIITFLNTLAGNSNSAPSSFNPTITRITSTDYINAIRVKSDASVAFDAGSIELWGK